MTEIKAIRYRSTVEYTRVVLDLSKTASFRSARIANPDRLYIDIPGSYLTRDVQNTLDVGEGPLKAVRAAQFDPRTVRVVFDLAEVEDFKIFSLDDPPRVIVDVFGQAGEKTGSSRIAVAGGRSDAEKKAAVERIAQAKRVAKEKRIPGKKHNIGNIRNVRRVVVDAGHGGYDPGASGPNGIKEKDVVLDIAKRIKRILENKGGYEVYLTRSRDKFMSLEERTDVANKKGADLFVSVHANAHNSRRVRGIETYFLNFTNNAEAMKVAARENKISLKRMHGKRTDRDVILASLQLQNNRDESLRLANYVQGSMVSSVGRRYTHVRNLGVKEALFYVLFGAKMPSVLVEVSFITNPLEAKRLKSHSYREHLASGIAAGIEKYFDTLPPEQKVAMRY